jgi:hypothetical protein
MSAKPKQPSARPSPTPPSAPVPQTCGPAAAEQGSAWRERHPKIASALFAALCVYVAMLWLLALDQTFHWGLFGPKLPPAP